MSRHAVVSRHRLAPVLARLAAALLCLVVAGILGLFFVVPRVTQGAALSVLTGSMAPELPVGSLVLTRSVDPASLRVGDVVTYQQSGSANLVTHRIVAISADHSSFTLRGDANPMPDPQAVPASAIRGKVWADLPYLGALRDRLGQGRPVAVVLGTILLSAISAWQFGSYWRDRRRARVAR